MSAPAKFLFDNDFGRGDARGRQAGVAEAIHLAAVSDARIAGYSEGFTQGRAEAALEAQQHIARVLDRLAAAMTQVADGVGDIERRLQGEAVEVAVSVARKLAPALIAREPFAEVAALAGDCLKSLLGAPHVVVRVNDALYEAAKAQLTEIAAASGFAGRVVVLAEPEVALGDCRIEWADGGVVRNRAETEAAIADAVCRYLAARRGAAASLGEN